MRSHAMVGICVALLVSAGCAPDVSEETPNPYAAEFEAAREQAEVPEILAALEDDVITEEEYAVAVSLTLDCFDARGITAEYLGEGRLRTQDPPDMDLDAMMIVYDECAGPHMSLLSPLYWDILADPENHDWPSAILDCFKKFDLVDDALTVDDFIAIDLDDPPWPKQSGDAFGCLSDPLGYEGGQPDVAPGEEWH